jgi:hypothetical protein
MDLEWQNLIANNTWEVCDLPKGTKAVNTIWTFKTKYNADNTIDKEKCRVVVDGRQQTLGIDYTKTFSPTANTTTVRILCALMLSLDFHVKHIDVTAAYLNADINDEVYIQLPSSHAGPHVFAKLKKSMYGLKQAAREWNKHLSTALLEFGFAKSLFDPCLFIYHENGQIQAIITTYVDDLLVFFARSFDSNRILEHLRKFYKITVSEKPNLYIGLNVTVETDRVTLSQKAYLDRLFQDHLNDGRKVTCPTTKLLFPGNRDDNDPLSDSITPYRSIIGKLSWIALGTRPDICFVVNMLASAVHAPTPQHYNVALNTIRYLRATSQSELIYKAWTNNGLIGYADAEWGSRRDRHSIGDYIVMVNSSPLSWKTIRLRYIATSTAEAEIGALYKVVRLIVTLRNIIKEVLPGAINQPVPIFSDSRVAVLHANDEISDARTRHLDIKVKYIQDAVEKKLVSVTHVASHENLADCLTRLFSGQRLSRMRSILFSHPPA